MLCLLAAQGAACSVELHDWLHPDADAAGHECAAVLLQEGVVETPPPVAVVSVPRVLRVEVPSRVSSTPEGFSLRNPPGRGPPPV